MRGCSSLDRASWQPRACVLLALLLLLSSCSPVAVASGSRSLLARTHPKDFAKPDYTLYHRKSALLEDVRAVVAANPGIMRMETIHKGDAKYTSDVQVVTVETSGLGSDHASKARVLIDYGEHAREFISVELGLRMLQTLADPAAIIRAVGDEQRGQRVIRILERVVFKVLPMENANGRDTVELRGQLCERKNGRGVDTNRNWSVDWGKKEKDYSAAEENPGAGPFSEPEVQAVLDVARALQPHVWLNIHSGMEAMFVPWDHLRIVAPEAAEAHSILQTIKKDLSMTKCVVGSGGKSVGYLAHGTATDFMFREMKVPLSYTWEIYGDLKADSNDCFRMFNPIGKEQFEATLQLWLKAKLYLIELLPSHPALAPIFQAQPAASSQLPFTSPTTTTSPTSSTAYSSYSGSSDSGSTAPSSQPQPTPDLQPAPITVGQLSGVGAMYPSSAIQIWKHAISGCVGMAFLVFLVVRFFKRTGPHPRASGKVLEDSRKPWGAVSP